MAQARTRQWTRMQAERAISRGAADPQQFADHPNKHVRAKAARKLGFASEAEWRQARGAAEKASAA